MCVILLVFHESSASISTAETVYEIYFGIFFICKIVGYFDCPSMLQHSHTAQAIQNSILQQRYSLQYRVAWIKVSK